MNLVTGVSGFTGGRLAEMLLEKGEAVRGLVREGSDASHLESKGLEVARGDLRDAAAVRAAMEGVTTAYHVAATFRHGGIAMQEYYDINVGGTQNMLDAARDAGIERFLHVSTVGVHGDVKDPPANEDAPFNPGDHYQKSKLEAEQLALRVHADHGLPLSVVRPAGIYGPGDTRFLKLFRSIARRRFVMIGNGKALYHFTYIDDLCRGMMLAASKPEALGRVYSIGGPPAVSLNDLVNTVADICAVKPPRLRVPFWPVYAASVVCWGLWKILPGNPPLFPRRVDFFRKTRWFDISRAERELGFVPEVELEDGMRRMYQWYKNEGLL